MRIVLIGLLVFVFTGLSFTTLAQSDEIIVTGSRLENYDIYAEEDGVPPHITIKKRASFLVLSVRVEGDTRQTVKREKEIRASLHNILQAAKRNPSISLGHGSEFVEDFTKQTIAKDLRDGRRAETSHMVLLIKTPVDANEITYSQALAIIDRFIASVNLQGRTEIIKQSQPVLSIVKPERFRGELLGFIANDARNTAAIFGEDYAVRATNMAERIRWIQSGKLTLTLYIPYSLEVLPKP
ncbi:MAG: hypothetical protein JKY46_01535 [Robiginitomaculum sp.]|nr:hypothetical protein [Robiginitomaculum sp.]